MTYVANPPCANNFQASRGQICRFATNSNLTFDSKIVGNTTIYYVAADTSGNTGYVSRTLMVKDTIPPIITLTGSPLVFTEAARLYTDVRATAADIVDGNITPSIRITNGVNTFPPSTPFNYTMRFNVNDKSNNSATQVTRTVTVRDTTLPVIALVGPDRISVEGATFYYDQFAVANDSYDGDLTAAITVSILRTSQTSCVKSRGCDGDNTKMDIHAPAGASFKYTYEVLDRAFNRATVSRTVVIIDTTPPTITLLGPSVFPVEGMRGYMYECGE
jgi:hypothetical protein